MIVSFVKGDGAEAETAGFAEYFQNLGFSYNWDFDERGHFHEIYKDKDLKIQIDFGPSIDEVIANFCQTEPMNTDWMVYGPDDNYKEVVDKVSEFEKNYKK